MSDRELLELAAKAAGIDARWFEAWEGYFIHEPHRLPISWKSWNPIRDDGDALRLAVKLEMELKVYDTSSHAASAFSGFSVCASEKGSPLAATRRAIVRAAAEIGRTL